MRGGKGDRVREFFFPDDGFFLFGAEGRGGGGGAEGQKGGFLLCFLLGLLHLRKGRGEGALEEGI